MMPIDWQSLPAVWIRQAAGTVATHVYAHRTHAACCSIWLVGPGTL